MRECNEHESYDGFARVYMMAVSVCTQERLEKARIRASRDVVHSAAVNARVEFDPYTRHTHTHKFNGRSSDVTLKAMRLSKQLHRKRRGINISTRRMN